jgi:2-dehydropantoate 2-reductase
LQLPASDNIGEFENIDIIFVTTKSYDTEKAAKTISEFGIENIPVLSVQNGIGNAEILGKAVGEENVVVGITSMAAYRVKPGVVRYVAEGDITLGSMTNSSTAIEITMKAISEAGISARISDNIIGALWAKATVNAAINPLTAILKCKNGRIAENEALRGLAEKVCEEGEIVACAKDIVLDPEDVLSLTVNVARRTAQNRSSMLMDIESGKRTEVDAICGSIIGAARESGISTPVISSLYSSVKFLESSNSYQKG